jgi:hypothetical protein
MSDNLRLWGALGVAAACGLLGCIPANDEPGAADPPDFPSAAGSVAFPRPGGSDAFCGSAGRGGSTSFGVMFSPTSPQFELPTQRAEQAPPPISGGTLLTSADGKTLIAADPDRDAIYLIDIAQRALLRRIELQPGDEPGRLVQDKSGKVHVALRGGRAIASFGLAIDAQVTRTNVCDLPRGLAYDGANDRVYVACAEGALVQVDPAAQKAVRKLDLGRDLRDVIVRGEQLFVSRFRSAELMAVNVSDGQLMGVQKPPATSQEESVPVEDAPVPGSCSMVPARFEQRTTSATPDVAWRALDVPNHGMMMLHQRASEGEVRVSPGGYGGSMTCAPGIVHGAVTVFGDQATSVDLAVPGLFVDMAVDPTGALLALANPAGWGTDAAVVVMDVPTPVSAAQNFQPNGTCMGPNIQVMTHGQPTAVSFVSPWLLAIQEREPAGITFFDVRPSARVAERLDLKQPSRNDTGHTLFHTTTGSGLACASCHAEAGDDAHTWTFAGIGARRTQNLRGGILGTEPFHWNGDMRDFSMLVDEVFVGRMAAPTPRPDQADALAHWIDRQPLLHATPERMDAVARGKALFTSEAVGCGGCHDGERLSNNQSADVGTGALLQVPSLRAVSFRVPLMHNGCATTVTERFAACGGGDKHGHTSQLKPEDIGDLVTYLESL